MVPYDRSPPRWAQSNSFLAEYPVTIARSFSNPALAQHVLATHIVLYAVVMS